MRSINDVPSTLSLRVCAGCEVRQPCLDYALTRCTDETDLIEGELTGSYVVGNTVLGVVFERTGQ